MAGFEHCVITINNKFMCHLSPQTIDPNSKNWYLDYQFYPMQTYMSIFKTMFSHLVEVGECVCTEDKGQLVGPSLPCGAWGPNSGYQVWQHMSSPEPSCWPMRYMFILLKSCYQIQVVL